MKKKWIDLLLLIIVPAAAFAQTGGYKFYGNLDSIKTSGLYNIDITPGLHAHIKTDYSDIRIVNDSGKWVPHILHVPFYDITGPAVTYDLNFSILENAAGNSELVIESRKEIMSNFSLLISNTAAERFCTLSGSNDKKNWYVINDSILLHPLAGDKATENHLPILFPASSYAFYKIVIHNKNKDPFHIKAVVENVVITSSLKKLVDNPPPQLQQKDSGKISYIKVTQQQAYQFDHISLQLSGVKYYSRQVELYVPQVGEGDFSNPGSLLHAFTVSNNSTLEFRLPLTKARVFYLLIRNEDNLPLKLTRVRTSSGNHYITAYLEEGNKYRLIVDNEDAVLPNYDLSALTMATPDSMGYLAVGKLTAFSTPLTSTGKANNNTWILWAAIAAALLILLFFTFKMMREVDKRKQDDRL